MSNSLFEDIKRSTFLFKFLSNANLSKTSKQDDHYDNIMVIHPTHVDGPNCLCYECEEKLWTDITKQYMQACCDNMNFPTSSTIIDFDVDIDAECDDFPLWNAEK
jgi:hypothetical protein